MKAIKQIKEIRYYKSQNAFWSFYKSVVYNDKKTGYDKTAYYVWRDNEWLYCCDTVQKTDRLFDSSERVRDAEAALITGVL